VLNLIEFIACHMSLIDGFGLFGVLHVHNILTRVMTYRVIMSPAELKMQPTIHLQS
jgi:hypothetical protein